MNVKHRKVEVDAYFIEDGPELIYFIESGYNGLWIQLSIDPCYGNEHVTISTEEKEKLERKLRKFLNDK